MAPNANKYIIRLGTPKDMMGYLKACQLSAAAAYSTEPPDSDKNLFGPAHYFHSSIMPYWKDMATNGPARKWWVAEADNVIIGGIALKIYPDHYEGLGFYVHPEWQNQGVGRDLLKMRQDQVDGPIFFEVYSHADKTISMHERHGARPTGRQRAVHWDSWPDDANLIALEYKSL